MATLAELKARKAEREAAQQKELERLEAEALELEEKYEAEGAFGKNGIGFLVVSTSIGNFVVRAPDFVVAKRFSDNDSKTTEDVIQFVMPCVIFPDRGGMTPVFEAHGGIAWKLALACLRMYQADKEALGGK